MTDARDAVGAFVAGVLCANSLPHLATAATGRRHLTPIAGRDSSPAVNAAWAAMNLVGGLVLARGVLDRGDRWDARLLAFEAGAATFALWMVGSEAVLKINWGRGRGE